MVEGVTKGYQKQLEITGVGYKAEVTPLRAAARARLLAPDRVQGAGGHQAHRAAADADRDRRRRQGDGRTGRGRDAQPSSARAVQGQGHQVRRAKSVRRKAGKAGGK